MKTIEELNRINEEYADLNKKLAELTEEELQMVADGHAPDAPTVDSRDWIQSPPVASM